MNKKMYTSSSCSSSSSSMPSLSPPPPLVFHPPTCFTPIQEENDNDDSEEGYGSRPSTNRREIDDGVEFKRLPTPLYQSDRKKGKESRRRKGSGNDDGGDGGGGVGVSWNKCRPGNREKMSVVPVDNNGVGRNSMASPNGLFKSILYSLTKKSPRTPSQADLQEEQWKTAVAELSHKVIQATKKRDDAILESSKLKYSVFELEKKLNKLEIYCHSLKSGLDSCNNKSPVRANNQPLMIGDADKVIKHFLVSIAESRSHVRILSRFLTNQFRQLGPKALDRISSLLHPYDISLSVSKNPRAIVVYLEALLNKTFFEDFETMGFKKSGPTQILNPIERCESNFKSFNQLQNLTWEEVLNRGTRHFSDEFSRFCDRKMSEVVGMLGWNKTWPEPLLQAFFGASKWIWLVHLLANSVHPSLPVFRVEKGVGYDSIYMEDMGGERCRKLVPEEVRVMVAPGFYVFGNVVKCKVISRYHNNSSGGGGDGSSHGSSDKGG
ncbi:IRK-interacting protein-like [Impatiens glandulifera]|uniref:IRK-interacting protein-like n=1 Tax=Impatiens glandulifera TaxID=253017 RepID=UPI001FB15C34|nr:IRK-interacting protein-like [Impatiens glandulifera]